MRFQKLTIHNIASIEDAVIDFEAEPLASSEVFLITGKTGAGKSTLLDAICLALYADTPRLDGTRMQGDTLDGEKTVRINDPRQLMRRNTGEAHVTLTFTGSNNVHYEATWAVSRARKKVTGNIQSKDWQLRNLDMDLTLNKEKEIEAEIQKAIGLDFNQFCRTTMLAQGEFTRFLNSKDDEKAEILEKITGVDVYRRIGARIFAMTGQKEQAWQEAQRQAEDIHTFSAEEVEGKQQELSALDAQHETLKTTSRQDTTKCEWLQKETMLSRQLQQAEEKLAQAKSRIESEDFKAKKALTDDWRATTEVRQWMNEATAAAVDCQQSQRDLEARVNEYGTLLYGQQQMQLEAERTELKIKETNDCLRREADKAPVYEQAQTLIELLKALEADRQTIDEKGKDIDQKQRQLDEQWLPAWTQAKQEAEAALLAEGKLEAEVKQHEDELDRRNLPQLRAKREEAKDLLNHLHTAKERLDTLAAVKALQEERRLQLAERLATLETKKQKAAAMEAPLREAEVKRDVHKKVLDQQSDTIHNFAKTLRSRLTVGDTCPVCRQPIAAELPHEEELAALVNGLREAYEKAEKEYNALSEEKLRLEAEVKTEAASCEREAKALEQDKSVANAETKATEACKACGIAQLDASTLSALEKLEQETQDATKNLDLQIQAGEQQEAALGKLRKQATARRKETERLNKAALEAEKKVGDCRTSIATAQTLVKSKEQEVKDTTERIAKGIASTQWETDWNESPLTFAQALDATARAYRNATQLKQQLEVSQQALQTNCEQVAAVVGKIAQAMPQWKDVEAVASRTVRMNDLLTAVNNLYNNVTNGLTRRKEAEGRLEKNQGLVETFLAEHTAMSRERLQELNGHTREEIAGCEAAIKHDQDDELTQRTLYGKAKDELEQHHLARPTLAEDETLENLLLRLDEQEKQLKAIGEKRGAILQELKIDADNKQRLGALVEAAEQKKAEYQKWSRLNQLLGDAQGSKFRKIAQSYVLSSLIHSANHYMRTLTDRYTLKVMPGTFVITIEDAYQGFVSRAASTISGGESFLVSLSLALALSDIGHRLSVDTLFIDEGFGTLSGEPLQNAIQTLRTLHTKAGRHVGIISHVEELQERIPIQIQVLQEGNASSSTVEVKG